MQADDDPAWMSTLIIEATANERHLTLKRRLPPRPLPPRPLPTLPRSLVCKTCSTTITCLEAIYFNSKVFKGFSGKALLFNKVFNATLAPPRVQLMATGVHTMQEITCSNCDSYLGWKIVAAHDSSEKWKEGGCLLELESLSNGDTG